MITTILILFGAILAISSFWLLRHRNRLTADIAHGVARLGQLKNRQAARRRSAPAKVPVNPYAGVMIRPCLEACAVATQQRGTRYLSTEAPTLPLPGCDTDECRCRYSYQDDRREHEDRRFSLKVTETFGMKRTVAERRSATRADRRASARTASGPRAYFNDY